MLKDMNSRQRPLFIFQLWVLLTRCLIKYGRNFMPMRVIDVTLQLVIGCIVGGIHGEGGGGLVCVSGGLCACETLTTSDTCSNPTPHAGTFSDLYVTLCIGAPDPM